MKQDSIFDLMYDKFTTTKPIRLIELFGGYGSQHFALEYLKANFEHYKLVEWAVKSIQAYKDAHYPNDNIDYSKGLSKDELVNYLFNKHISMDYNEPMSLKQIKSKNEEWLRQVYNNIQATKNIVDIQNTKASDLEIVDTDKYTYIMTYSFPCQDLSLAGLGKGMARDSGTRSGMLWEVERILDECVELPQILLMENVPEVKGTNNVQYFNEWQSKLESLGYKNYHQNLIATDYGIPQTRNRTFMVSILGNYNFTFPNAIPLKLKLKDMLEKNVNEKYYLSDKMIDYMTGKNANESKYNRGEVFARNFDENKEVAATITTLAGNRATDNFICISKHLRETLEKNKKEIKDGSYIDAYNRIIRDDNLSSTISTRINASNDTYVALTKNTENYIEWEQKGRLDIDCRAWKDEKVVSTLHTNSGNIKVLENSDNMKTQLCNTLIEKGMVQENDVIKHSYTNNKLDDSRLVPNHNISPTLDTRCDCLGVVVKSGMVMISEATKQGYAIAHDGDGINLTQPEQVVIAAEQRTDEGLRTFVNNNMGTLRTTDSGGDKRVIENNLRIRKLTPKECFRLMGVKDEDYENIAKNQSDSSLYHLAGDSIVVNVLMAIFGELLDIDWKDCVKKAQ